MLRAGMEAGAMRVESGSLGLEGGGDALFTRAYDMVSAALGRPAPLPLVACWMVGRLLPAPERDYSESEIREFARDWESRRPARRRRIIKKFAR